MQTPRDETPESDPCATQGPSSNPIIPLTPIPVFCRGVHQAQIGPLELTPVVPGGAGFLQANVQVPEDASVLDLEFSDSGGSSGGFVDSNHGLGYHVPIGGSRVPQPSLSVCHISVEMAPIAKVSLLSCLASSLLSCYAMAVDI